jgi:flavin reductase (DIM6/NTAB) family NADH-FMN oxidoreductase RutF
VPSIDLKEEMHYCGIKSGKDMDKFAETGLTPVKAIKVRPPLIEECFSHLKCKMVQQHIFGNHTLFVGKVVATSVNEEVMKGNALDILKARQIIQKNHIYYTVCPR